MKSSPINWSGPKTTATKEDRNKNSNFARACFATCAPQEKLDVKVDEKEEEYPTVLGGNLSKILSKMGVSEDDEDCKERRIERQRPKTQPQRPNSSKSKLEIKKGNTFWT